MNDIKALEDRMDKRFDELTSLMSNCANDVMARFDEHDARFDTIDARLGKLEAKIERLERWIQQVASKTGVTLS